MLTDQQIDIFNQHFQLIETATEVNKYVYDLNAEQLNKLTNPMILATFTVLLFHPMLTIATGISSFGKNLKNLSQIFLKSKTLSPLLKTTC